MQVNTQEIIISFTLNGEKVVKNVQPNWTLLDLLRKKLRVRSPKEGCLRGDCGACTVLLNGKPVNSCLVLAPKVDGATIVTVEGLKGDPVFEALKETFAEKGAVQCGFCTPGMILSAKYLLDRKKNPTQEEIEEAIEGNLCRCTGYIKIVEAIKEAAKKLI